MFVDIWASIEFSGFSDSVAIVGMGVLAAGVLLLLLTSLASKVGRGTAVLVTVAGIALITVGFMGGGDSEEHDETACVEAPDGTLSQIGKAISDVLPDDLNSISDLEQCPPDGEEPGQEQPDSDQTEPEEEETEEEKEVEDEGTEQEGPGRLQGLTPGGGQTESQSLG